MPITSIDMGLFFDRETTLGGKSYLHTLNPRLFYLNTPYRDQPDLPLFDTRAHFSWGQAVHDSCLPAPTGQERCQPADHGADHAPDPRSLDGREKLSASISHRSAISTTPRVTVNPGDLVVVSESKSAWPPTSTGAGLDR